MNRRTLSILAVLLSFVLGNFAFGQPASNANGAAQVVSPDVAADRSVTFRLYAPNAKSVTLNGDFTLQGIPDTSMTRDTNGVWSRTLPPREPGIYGYYFRVDNLRIVDPGNLYITSGAQYLKSFVAVEGGGPQFWSQRNVPHGEVHEVWYQHPTLGQRRFFVYTPPGYDGTSPKTYPAVYLLHAATDNESFWTQIGRANFIMDNLIADGEAKPALVVMSFGHLAVPPGPEGGTNAGDPNDAMAIGRDITEQVMPIVEKEYHAGKEAKDRAIFGFAMGGYQAVSIGMNHPGVFGYVAGSSATFRPNTDLAGFFKGLNADLPGAKENIKFINLMVGSQESGSIPANKRVADYLTGLGLKTEMTTPSGGTHTWQSWRGYFRDLMERKFFKDDPYSAPPVGPIAATNSPAPK